MATRRLLYVDDDDELRRLVKHFFELRFPAYEVILASGAGEALQELLRRKDTPEFPRAVAIDIELKNPGEGVGLMQEIRHQYPTLCEVVVFPIVLRPKFLRGHPIGQQIMVGADSLDQYVERLFNLIQTPTNELPSLINALL